MENQELSFSALDYIIFVLMLSISAGIGIFYGCFGKKQTSSKEILVANRQMGVFPAAMSLLASFMSGITILGNPSEAYNYGTMFLWTGIAYILVTLITANVFIPIFHELKVTSAYEYLELRFNKYVKLLASCIFITQMTIYMALVCYAPALAINQVTGLNTWISVFSVGIVCTFYTTIGGMKAVMWTDTFQIFIMLIGLLSSLIKGIMDAGGIRNILEANWKNDRIEIFNFDFNPTVRHTAWGLTLGSMMQWLAIYGVNQSQVQRYLSVPTAKMAKKAIYYNLLGLIFILTVTILIGMTIYTKYQFCDPVLNKQVLTGEQLYPFFVLQTLRSVIGLPGLFLACLFSAALSTISSGLNSLAAVVLEDILKSFFIKDMSDENGARISKALCIIFGVLCLVLTYLASFLGTLLQATLSLFGVIGGPILGVFILGLFVPFSNPKGAIVGTITGLIFMIWLFAGFNIYGIKYPKKPFSTIGCSLSNYSNESMTTTAIFPTTTMAMSNTIENSKSGIEIFHSISYTWYGSIAVLVVNIVGIVVSLITGKNKKEVDPKYIIPVFEKLYALLPEYLRKYLCCGLSKKVEPKEFKREIIESIEINYEEQRQQQIAENFTLGLTILSRKEKNTTYLNEQEFSE